MTTMQKNPVCGMDVNPKAAQHRSVYEGNTYDFCATGRQWAFESDSKTYLGRASSNPYDGRLSVGPG
jgi:YHS domain-containing protein